MRHRWFLDLCSGLESHLSEGSLAVLAGLSCTFGEPDLVRGLFLGRVAWCGLHSWSVAQIIQEFASVPVVRRPGAAELRGLVTEVVDCLHRGLFGDRPTLELRDVYCGLVEYWASLRSTEVGASRTAEELHRLWGIVDAALTDLYAAPHGEPFAVWSTLARKCGDGVVPGERNWQALIVGLAMSSPARTSVERRLACYRPELREAGHLDELAREIELTQYVLGQCQPHLSQAASEDPAFHIMLTEAIEAVSNHHKHIGTILRELTAYEVGLLQPVMADTRFQDHCLATLLKFIPAHAYERDGVPDLGVDDPAAPVPAARENTAAPDWIRDRVLYGGFRVWHGRLGAVPWWFATMEGQAEEQAAMGIAAGAPLSLGVRDREHPEYFHVVLPDRVSGSSDLRLPLCYDLHHLVAACELLLLARAGFVRLDILALRGDGDVHVLRTLRYHLSEKFRVSLETRATARLRQAVGEDPEQLLDLLIEGHAPSSAVAVQASELAKSEDLLEELDVSGPAAHPDSPIHVAARSLARLRVKATDLFLLGQVGTERDSVAAKVRHAEQRLRVARQEEGPFLTVSAVPHSAEDRLLPGLRALGGDDRLLLHLTVEGGSISGHWARTVGPQVACGSIAFEDVDLERLQAAVSTWIELRAGNDPARQVHYLDALRRALVPIAAPIGRLAAEQDVQHLVLSPTWLLDMVPLHAAPTADEPDAPLLLDMFRSVTYAPSALILQRLAERSSPPGTTALAVAHGEDLVDAEAEVNALCLLDPTTTLLTGPAATPAAVLHHARDASLVHIASHCATEEDFYASGLMLAGGAGSGRLSVARILADGDFSRTRLVVLSSCGSGAHPRTTRALQQYRAVDGAFLARGARATLSTLWEVADLPALVMMVILRTEIHAGQNTMLAYRKAVDYFRHRTWQSDSSTSISPSATCLLDATAREWRSQLALGEYDGIGYDHPYHWAGYKLSGLLW